MQSIFSLEEHGKIHCLAFEELKKLSIRDSVKSRKLRQDVASRTNKLFGRQLHELPLESVKVGPDEDYEFEVPVFIVKCCKMILSGIDTEGIFRKAGSAKRQREIKIALNAGDELSEDLHVVDVANLLKQFLRELPEPLVPHSLHDIFISCTQLKEKKIEALQLACLMISNLTALATLCYICQVLDVVAASSAINMMNVSNLAIIMVPSLMPLPEANKGQRGNPAGQNPRLLSHKDVIELLIKHSAVLGMLPECLLPRVFPEQYSVKSERKARSRENLSLSKGKKKRRSASFTRMMEGIRKMVRRSQSPGSEMTPDNLDTISVHSQKRKKDDKDSSFSSTSSKKRKLGSKENIFETTPFTPEMRHNFKFGNEDLSHRLFQSPALSLEPSPSMKPALGFPASDCKKSKKFFTPKRLALRSQSKRLGPVAAAAPLTKAKEMKRRLSIGKKDKQKNPAIEAREEAVKTESDVEVFEGSNPAKEITGKSAVELHAQYQDLKFQVDQAAKELIDVAKEDRIASPTIQEPSQAVTDAFLKTIDGTSELVQNCSESDQVVKILSKELKIRRSAEHKVIRSPSARKIGAVRRRSRETPKSLSQRSLGSPRRSRTRLTRSHSAVIGGKVVKLTPLLVARNLDRTSVRSNLRRGKPNTLRTGLPEPSPMRSVIGSAKRRSQGRASIESTVEGRQLDFSSNSTFNSTLQDENQPDHVPNGGQGSDIQRHGSVQQLVKAFEVDMKYGSSTDLTEKSTRNNFYYPMELRNSPKFQSMPEHLEEAGAESQKTSRRESILWQSAENFFKNVQATECDKRGRDSLKRLRAENAGKVYENVKIFDQKEDAFSRKVETYQSLPVRTRGKSTTHCQLVKPLPLKEEIASEIHCAGKLCQAHQKVATPRSRANIDQILAESCESRKIGSPRKPGLIETQENIESLLSMKLNFDDPKSPLKDSSMDNEIFQTPVPATPKLKPFLTPLKEATPRIGRAHVQRRASPMKPLLGEGRRRSPRLNSSPNLALNYGLTPKPKSELDF